MDMKWDTGNHPIEIGSYGHVIAINLVGMYTGDYTWPHICGKWPFTRFVIIFVTSNGGNRVILFANVWIITPCNFFTWSFRIHVHNGSSVIPTKTINKLWYRLRWCRTTCYMHIVLFVLIPISIGVGVWSVVDNEKHTAYVRAYRVHCFNAQ